MGWNQPIKKKTVKPRHKSIWVVTAIAVFAIAFLYWLANRQNVSDNREAKIEPARHQRNSIAEVKPQKAHKRDSAISNVTSIDSKDIKPQHLPPQRVGELRDGYRLLPSGRMHRVLGTIKARDTSNEWLGKAFPEPSDQLIAGLIMVEPGETLIGNPESYYRNFAEQFQASLLNPIRIEKDDDQYTRELKEAVKATREELVSRLKAGEDVVQIMIDTRKQYQELGLYRNELKNIVRQNLADGEISATEYEELVKAANIMLEDRGSKPLDLPETFKKYVEMMNLDINETETIDEE